MSNNWAVIKATPDPIAILTEIKSAKSVENNNVNIIPIKNPKYTICLANNFPYDLFAKSVIRKAIGVTKKLRKLKSHLIQNNLLGTELNN